MSFATRPVPGALRGETSSPTRTTPKFMVYETAVTAGAWTLPSTVTVCTTPTVELLSSCVAYNNVRHEDLWGLISTTHAALAKLGTAAPPEADAEPLVRDHEPAVSARRSLAHCDRIPSMTDGSRTGA